MAVYELRLADRLLGGMVMEFCAVCERHIDWDGHTESSHLRAEVEDLKAENERLSRLLKAAPDLLEGCRNARLLLLLLSTRDRAEETAREETVRILAKLIDKVEGE